MADTSKLRLVRDSVLAAELTAEQIAVLAELVTVRDPAEGEIRVDEGESDDHVHVVVSGALAVAKQMEAGQRWINLNVLTKGDLAGELGFMDGKPHYAALRATVPTRVLSLGRGKAGVAPGQRAVDRLPGDARNLPRRARHPAPHGAPGDRAHQLHLQAARRVLKTGV